MECKSKIKNTSQKSNVVVEISRNQNALKSSLLGLGAFIHFYFLSPNDICLESEIFMLLCMVWCQMEVLLLCQVSWGHMFWLNV